MLIHIYVIRYVDISLYHVVTSSRYVITSLHYVDTSLHDVVVNHGKHHYVISLSLDVI